MDRPSAAPLEAAIRFLSRRDRLSEEVRRHLVSKGVAAADVEEVVSYLQERKLLDDARTTQSLISRQSGKRAVGTERLRAELIELGAPENAIETELSGLDDSARALEALRGKFKSPVPRAKAARFLDGRGFGEEAIVSALDSFCGSEPFPE